MKSLLLSSAETSLPATRRWKLGSRCWYRSTTGATTSRVVRPRRVLHSRIVGLSPAAQNSLSFLSYFVDRVPRSPRPLLLTLRRRDRVYTPDNDDTANICPETLRRWRTTKRSGSLPFINVRRRDKDCHWHPCRIKASKRQTPPIPSVFAIRAEKPSSPGMSAR